jgi:hypothetical protein
MRLFAGLSPLRSRFTPGPVHISFWGRSIFARRLKVAVISSENNRARSGTHRGSGREKIFPKYRVQIPLCGLSDTGFAVRCGCWTITNFLTSVTATCFSRGAWVFADTSTRAVLGVSLRPVSWWDLEFDSRRSHGYLSRVKLVCCQVEVSDTRWSLVQGRPTECLCNTGCEQV